MNMNFSPFLLYILTETELTETDLDLDLVKYFTGTLSFEWVINVKGGI